MKGPFFAERDIVLSSDFLVAMLDTTNLLVARLGVAFIAGAKTENQNYLLENFSFTYFCA